MPYPTEHSCRLRDPGEFSEFRRSNGARKHKGKSYDVIYGKQKSDGAWSEQAYRYDAKTWDAADAKAHCQSHKGKTFESSSGK